MKKRTYEMELDDRKVSAVFNGRVLSFSDKEVIPSRASLDLKRIIPLYVAIIIVFAVILAGMMVGALIGTTGAAIVSVSVAAGVGAVTYLALSRVEQVLLIDAGSETFEFKGSSEDLRSLYYEISKVTIRKMKEKEKTEGASMRGVGVTRGDSIFEKEELDNVRSNLKRSGIINKKMVTQICPQCGHDELYYEGGLMTGHVYHCKRCDYVGSLVMEREIDFRNGK